ncbi:MAG TPA: O-antigen ligase family protein [Gaiellaceae bacterium]|nr:O-antigen ligase family protein [Gaiellaceae bacterium]
MSRLGATLRTEAAELAVGATLGLTIVCMVLGSSSLHEVIGPGKKLRWVALVAFAAIACALALRDWRRLMVGRPLARVFAFGAWFTAIAIISTAWSVDEKLSFERACSLLLVFAAGGALALAVRTRPQLPVRMLEGVLGATVAVALVGIALLGFRHAAAVQPVSVLYPARFRGLGQNPDTVAMLCGISAPIALWSVLRSRSSAGRLSAGLALVLLVGTIAASGSRGGIVAALAGGLVLSLAYPMPLRQRLSTALGVVVLMSGATAVTQIPKPASATAQNSSSTSGQKSSGPALPSVGSPLGVSEKQYAGRLQDELYRVQAGKRSLLQSSGRFEAWRGAIGQANARPLLGYGFGTENKVFISRFYNFNGAYVENSFIGIYLQLGAIGLTAFVALLAALCLAAALAIRRANAEEPAPTLAAVLATGIVLMLVQSYVYSIGNIVTVAFWVCSFTVAGLAVGPRPAVVEAVKLPKGGVVAPA